MEEKRVLQSLVTGGAGFLGSHLCEKLLSTGREVICVDNFFTGSKANIRPLLSDPGFELLRRGRNGWRTVMASQADEVQTHDGSFHCIPQ